MGLRIKIITLVIGILFFLFVFKFVKNNRFRPAFAVLWIALSIFLLSIPILEFLYQWIAHTLIGIIDTRHVIYVGIIGFLLVYNFYISIIISNMNDQIQQLISYTAILEKKLKE